MQDWRLGPQTQLAQYYLKQQAMPIYGVLSSSTLIYYPESKIFKQKQVQNGFYRNYSTPSFVELQKGNVKAKCSMENLVGFVMGVKNNFNTWSDANTRIQKYGNCGFKKAVLNMVLSLIFFCCSIITFPFLLFCSQKIYFI